VQDGRCRFVRYLDDPGPDFDHGPRTVGDRFGYQIRRKLFGSDLVASSRNDARPFGWPAWRIDDKA
jgi:hypothetical protein